MSRPATTRIDLHVHTNASDGTLSAKAVVKLAAQLNLEAISITDHDSVAGIDEAQAAASSLGLLVIPGVELSIDKGGSEIHLLGYLLDHHYEPLTRTLGPPGRTPGQGQRDRAHPQSNGLSHFLARLGS